MVKFEKASCKLWNFISHKISIVVQFINDSTTDYNLLMIVKVLKKVTTNEFILMRIWQNLVSK